MSTHFFTNIEGNTLINKFEKIFTIQQLNLEIFHAVSGYFYSSAYFKLQPFLDKHKEIKIIVGIKADSLTHKMLSGEILFKNNELEEKEEYKKQLIEELKNVEYSQQIEQSISDFLDDIIRKRVELRIHSKKNLHAKFYLLLPDNYNEHAPGYVIMGSSNLTEKGIGTSKLPNYELNVELRDYDDIKFAENEFQKLWQESISFTPENAKELKELIHFNTICSPHELYIKLLIEHYGELIDDQTHTDNLPSPYKDISYQRDAVSQGFKMLLKHNGFFLADVVGLGKTIVAVLIARRFIQENGGRANILVVHPPALRENWIKTFAPFNLKRNGTRIDFVSANNLKQITEAEINNSRFGTKDDYDLILVDEAHRFKNEKSQMFGNLQNICKAKRIYQGRIKGAKKVMLISATPFNNSPEDVLNLLKLFQDVNNSTLSQTNLTKAFEPVIKEYQELLKGKEETLSKEEERTLMQQTQELMQPLREKIMYEITVRRKRNDLLKIDRYKDDLKTQKIIFPEKFTLKIVNYHFKDNIKGIFFTTHSEIVENLKYARHQMVTYLKPEYQIDYDRAKNSTKAIVGIMKTMMVKRLESSFEAFRHTVKRFLNSTQTMIELVEKDRAVIASNEYIGKLEEKINMSLEDPATILFDDGKDSNVRYHKKEHFEEGFIDDMKSDAELLKTIIERWDKIGSVDPKLDTCIEAIEKEALDQKINPSGKLIVFTEYNDTANYLESKFKEKLNKKVIKVSSQNINKLFKTIQDNFDENISEDQKKNDYQVLITTDVLAEGINLHRANVIFNYDTPWNATKLIQRAGRVNRIGSKVSQSYSFVVYPSKEVEEKIKLSQKSITKSQGFLALLGGDNQIYSLDELKEEFELFENKEAEENKHLVFLEELRKFKQEYLEEFEKIKKMFPRAKTGRLNTNAISTAVRNNTIAFLKTEKKSMCYQMTEKQELKEITPYQLFSYFKAEPDEKAVQMPNKTIRKQHDNAVQKFQEHFKKQQKEEQINKKNIATKNVIDSSLIKWLRNIEKEFSEQNKNNLLKICQELTKFLNNGTYVELPTQLKKLKKEKYEVVEQKLEKLYEKFGSSVPQIEEEQQLKLIEFDKPQVIVAETFMD